MGELTLIHGKTIFCHPYSFIYCIAQEQLMTMNLVGQKTLTTTKGLMVTPESFRLDLLDL